MQLLHRLIHTDVLLPIHLAGSFMSVSSSLEMEEPSNLRIGEVYLLDQGEENKAFSKFLCRIYK